MKKLEWVKLVGGIIVSVGVGSIVNGTVKSTTIPTGPISKVCIWVASAILTGMISDKAVDYTEQSIDKAATSVKNMVENGELS